MTMNSSKSYFPQPAAAYVRGRHLQTSGFDLPEHLLERPLAALSGEEIDHIIRTGREAGLRLHRFKRTMGLPRVWQVLGILREIYPADVLDIGSGRGAFLWPLLDAFTSLPVTATDSDERRASQIQAVQLGGIERLTAHLMDATNLEFVGDSFDVVTMLEVLEHIPEPSTALAEVIRVARRFVILSVPSNPDDNPQHVHLFNERKLRRMFEDAGVERVNFEYVLNHMIAVANVEQA